MTRPLAWGLIGGGAGSQVGPLHRIAAAASGAVRLTAGALDADPAAGRSFALELGIAPERAYGSWSEMLAAERDRSDRVDLVTVATPNASHAEIATAFAEAGFAVLCEKPMAASLEEARAMAGAVSAAQVPFAVNYGYCGYPMVRQMRAMVSDGSLGTVRLVIAEFAHGHHAGAGADENDRLRWRYDPAAAGASAVLADAGSHALHMACFVLDDRVERLSADFAHCVSGRVLEDDAQINLRFGRGAVGRLWTSAVALGRIHGLTLQIFGSAGGLSWHQQDPDRLAFTPLGEPTRILERGMPGLAPEAASASRIAAGHPEGLPLAIANIYADLASRIRSPGPAAEAGGLLAGLADGLHLNAAVEAAVASAAGQGAWTRVSG